MDAETAAPPSAAHLQLDSPMRPQVIKFCYKKRSTGHSRNGKDDSSQDPKIQPPSSSLSRQSLSTSAIPTYHAGWLYEIDHERLPPRTPIHLKSIRVVKVSEYTSLDITVSFPSLLALRSFFSSSPAPSAGPELDERFVMSSNHAARILRRRVAEEELEGGMHEDSFWLVNPCLYDFSASSHPATLADALSSPEAPPAQPKAPAPSSCLLDTLKCDGAGWGVRRRIRYIGRHRDASKEASIGGYETEASVQELQSPPQQEDKRSSVSGKRKRGESETSNDKPRTERMAKKKKTYRSPKKQKKRHVESKDGDPWRGKDRWSAERYTAAERSLLEIMRSSGARLGAPVIRQALREQACKRIGDTVLLDHLLKHMAGRVPDGSTERFRRRHNADGAMEYWLEPADLTEVRREAGVSDPYWMPPPGWKPGDDVSPAAGDFLIKRQVEKLTEELDDVKRHVEQLSSNMVQLGKEAKSEAERAHSSWKDKYQKVIKANETIEKQILSSKDNYENVVQKNSKLMKEVRVPDGSTERFRRRHNTDGSMEYWLEPADLAEVRREAGVSDPYWVPPPGWKPCADVPPAAGDLLIKRQVEKLTEELDDVKRHVEQLSTNMLQLGKEAKSEAESAQCSWKDKYQKVVKANEKIEKQILSLKDNYENVVQKNSKLMKEVRVPDGSTERFRRRHNTDGSMEYWLEPADLAEVRREAGVSDPYWVPPPGWKPCADVPPAAGDLLIKRQVEKLTEELDDVKRHVEQLSTNMLQLGKEAKSEAESAQCSWKAIKLDSADAVLYSSSSCQFKCGEGHDALIDVNACVSLQPQCHKGPSLMPFQHYKMKLRSILWLIFIMALMILPRAEARSFVEISESDFCGNYDLLSKNINGICITVQPTPMCCKLVAAALGSQSCLCSVINDGTTVDVFISKYTSCGGQHPNFVEEIKNCSSNLLNKMASAPQVGIMPRIHKNSNIYWIIGLIALVMLMVFGVCKLLKMRDARKVTNFTANTELTGRPAMPKRQTADEVIRNQVLDIQIPDEAPFIGSMTRSRLTLLKEKGLGSKESSD